jgi:hypothetical protein
MYCRPLSLFFFAVSYLECVKCFSHFAKPQTTKIPAMQCKEGKKLPEQTLVKRTHVDSKNMKC